MPFEGADVRLRKYVWENLEFEEAIQVKFIYFFSSSVLLLLHGWEIKKFCILFSASLPRESRSNLEMNEFAQTDTNT